MVAALRPSADRLVRMLAQTAVRPGIERVMDDLVQYEPSGNAGKVRQNPHVSDMRQNYMGK
jgi:hypothetical protein